MERAPEKENMMKIAFTSTLAFAMVLAGCTEMNTTPPGDFELAGTVQGTGEWQAVTGQAVVTGTVGAGSFVASMQVSGDEPGAVRPWHVHHNSCAAGGGIVGTDGNYPRLEIGSTGTASAQATVPAGLDTMASYHVNVHLSETQMDVIIACGDLALVP
jgi:superoxide dismutase, Cu-Zn family